MWGRAVRRAFSWVIAASAFYIGGMVAIVPAMFLAWTVGWLSWRLYPDWRSTLPTPLLTAVSLALTAGVLYAELLRRRAGKVRFARAGGLPLVSGFAIGLGVWFAASMVEVRIEPSAVSERQLLAEVDMPGGFVAYDWGFQGNDVGANVYYVGPSGALDPEDVEVPETFSRLPYAGSIQEYPEGWRALARWGGPDPYRSGRCDLSMDVARRDVDAFDLEGLDEADIAAVRDGSMRAVYLVAYCGYQ